MFWGVYTPGSARRFSGTDLVYTGRDFVEIARVVTELTGKAFNAAPAETRDPTLGYELYPELRYVTLRTSSGCPFRCSYCGWYLLEDGFRQEDPGKVFNQIEHFAQKGIDNFAYYDDALLYNAEDHLVKILERVVKSRIKVNLHTPNGLHIRFITPGLAVLMKQAGFIRPGSAWKPRRRPGRCRPGEKSTARNSCVPCGF